MTATRLTDDVDDIGARILIVEDSSTQAEKLKHLLEEDGYRVTAAATGTQALLAAHREKPALILSDIVMPEMDGYAFCKAVKSDDRLKDVPVILMTSLSSAGDVVKGLQCGADNFIRKPYEDKYLLARINYALTNRTLRHTENVQFGVHILLGGERHFITADRQQILDLLISTYEEAVHVNEDLKAKEQQLARSNRALAGLYRIAKVLNKATSQQELLEQVLVEAMELPSVQAGWFLLREGDTGFRVAAARGLPPALNIPGAMDSDCLCRRRLLSGELSEVTNILECERLQKAQGDTQGLRYHASVPLWAGDRMVGVMNLAGSQEGLFRDEELQLLNGVGSQIALGLERLAAKARAEQFAQQLADRVEVAEIKYQTLMHHANDAIFVLDPAGPVMEVNRQAEAMLGRPSADMVGHPFTDLVSPTSFDKTTTHFRRLVNTGTLQADDIHLRHADGRQVCADLSASLVPVRGEPVVLAIVRDVTERNHLARQFQQAQKMEAIGQLAGGVAHDFNNLLTVILGYGEILLDTLPADDPRREDVEEVRKAGQSAASLTRQLLAFSRKQILEPVVLDLNAVLANVDRMVGRLIGEDIELITRLDPALGRVKADAGQLEQIVVNLAVNARDAMPEGGTLTIETGNVELDEEYARTHPGAASGQHIVLAVTDTGHGMDEQTQSHLFEPFFTTKEKGKGTGLGLATVYGIVEQSGGSIWVDSELKRGTTFKAYFPRVEGVAVPLVAAKSSGQPPRGTETILLAEDASGLRILARRILERYGYTVLEASNGDEALQVCEQHQGAIHLLLTDVVMPGISGRTLADRVALLHPTTKVLYSSGYTDDAIVQRGVLSAGTAFLQKPYTAEAMARKVRDVLDA
jgi:two-component system, cell cycle sensor histidine kinase and response regulator CckA